MKTFEEYSALIAELHELSAAGRVREIAAARKKVIALIREHGLTLADPAERTSLKQKYPITTVVTEFCADATGAA